MIEMNWCRTSINRHLGRLKTIFRWGTQEELVPGDVYHALQSVGGLKKGRCAARESKPVRPVPHGAIEAVRDI